VVSTAKAEQMLGWAPETDPTKEIRAMAQWYLRMPRSE
jgi:nucleoside-diphosphate-sugar epimerase